MKSFSAVTISIAFILISSSLSAFPGSSETIISDTVKKDTTGFSVYKDLPLKPARKISFNTNEGSWISLDVSPDGKTIVFDMMGDLYTMPITGGKAVAITKGLAFDNHPRYSPDGKKILF